MIAILIGELIEQERGVGESAEQYWTAYARHLVAERKVEAIKSLIEECRTGKKRKR